jgi:hypothetical protein
MDITIDMQSTYASSGGINYPCLTQIVYCNSSTETMSLIKDNLLGVTVMNSFRISKCLKTTLILDVSILIQT